MRHRQRGPAKYDVTQHSCRKLECPIAHGTAHMTDAAADAHRARPLKVRGLGKASAAPTRTTMTTQTTKAGSGGSRPENMVALKSTIPAPAATAPVADHSQSAVIAGGTGAKKLAFGKGLNEHVRCWGENARGNIRAHIGQHVGNEGDTVPRVQLVAVRCLPLFDNAQRSLKLVFVQPEDHGKVGYVSGGQRASGFVDEPSRRIEDLAIAVHLGEIPEGGGQPGRVGLVSRPCRPSVPVQAGIADVDDDGIVMLVTV